MVHILQFKVNKFNFIFILVFTTYPHVNILARLPFMSTIRQLIQILVIAEALVAASLMRRSDVKLKLVMLLNILEVIH